MGKQIITEVEMETWKNEAAGPVYVKRWDSKGGETYVGIHGGRQFTLTPNERRMNEDIIASDELNIFRNGTLTPVRLIENDEDTAAIQTATHAIGDEELKSLISEHPARIAKKLKEITNPIVIHRIKELGILEDISVSKQASIQARLDELDPENAHRKTDGPITPDDLTDTGK